MKQAADLFDTEAVELYSQRWEHGELPANYPRPYFKWDEIESSLNDKIRLAFATFGTEKDNLSDLGFSAAPGFGGQLPLFIDRVKQLLKQNKRIILTSYQFCRLEELLEEAGIFAPSATEIKDIPLKGSLTLLQGSLAAGWVMNDETYLFTDAEIFGFVKQHRLSRKRPVSRHKLYTDFATGDFVVHIEHGIGKFAGVINMGSDGNRKEYMVLQYAAGDKLYVPTDQIDRVSRYIGAGEKPPVLTRLGTQEWSQTKNVLKSRWKMSPKTCWHYMQHVKLYPALLLLRTMCGSRNSRLPSLMSRRPTR